MKQETLEEAAVDYISEKSERAREYGMVFNAIRFGAKWQAERMYSEEDMINFANFKINNLIKHIDKTGFYLGTNKVLEIWKEEFKNN